MDRKTDRWMDGRINGWAADEWINGWADRWINR